MKQRADGRYQIQVDLGTDETGKRIRKTVYGASPKEAKKNADALRLAFGRGIDPSEINTKLSRWIELFLINEKRKSTESVYKNKKYRLLRFEGFVGANTPLINIKTYTINAFLFALADEDKSQKTIKEYKNVINQLFRFARINEGIVNNPCDNVQIPKARQKKERRALTSTEQLWLANLPDEIYPGKAMALVCMWAGLRRGEATALTWADIDFKQNMIRVTKAYDFKSDTLKEPKTEAGVRYVPLLPCLAEYLKRLPRNSAYVFGKRLSQWEWDRELAHILRYLESEYGNPKATPKTTGSKYVVSLTIDPFTWHELRHTYCTLLYDNDIPLKVAMNWMGHKSQDMTAKVYSHLSEEKKTAATEMIMTYGSQIVVNKN